MNARDAMLSSGSGERRDALRLSLIQGWLRRNAIAEHSSMIRLSAWFKVHGGGALHRVRSFESSLFLSS